MAALCLSSFFNSFKQMVHSCTVHIQILIGDDISRKYYLDNCPLYNDGCSTTHARPSLNWDLCIYRIKIANCGVIHVHIDIYVGTYSALGALLQICVLNIFIGTYSALGGVVIDSSIWIQPSLYNG